MQIEDWVVCPHCEENVAVDAIVPNSAWGPGGANWKFKQECMSCDKIIELEGVIESSIELA